ncbi:unnamed protein product [Effrenium voratum]|nr:unnamed protein product [Effrenium voratum]
MRLSAQCKLVVPTLASRGMACRECRCKFLVRHDSQGIHVVGHAETAAALRALFFLGRCFEDPHAFAGAALECAAKGTLTSQKVAAADGANASFSHSMTSKVF